MTRDRSRLRLAAAVAVAAAAAVLGALLLAGGAEGGGSTLAWGDDVRIYDSTIATDRVLAGQLRSTSLEDVDLDVEDVKLYDAQGDEVQSSVRFLAAFAHGLYPWSQKPDDVGDFERRRLGEVVTIKPGRSAPITLSWRVPEGGDEPARVDFGPIELDLPRR